MKTEGTSEAGIVQSEECDEKVNQFGLSLIIINHHIYQDPFVPARETEVDCRDKDVETSTGN